MRRILSILIVFALSSEGLPISVVARRTAPIQPVVPLLFCQALSPAPVAVRHKTLEEQPLLGPLTQEAVLAEIQRRETQVYWSGFDRWVMADPEHFIPLIIPHLERVGPKTVEKLIKQIARSNEPKKAEWLYRISVESLRTTALENLIYVIADDLPAWDGRLATHSSLSMLLQYGTAGMLATLSKAYARIPDSRFGRQIANRVEFNKAVEDLLSLWESPHRELPNDLARLSALSKELISLTSSLEELKERGRQIDQLIRPGLRKVNPGLAAALPDLNSFLALGAMLIPEDRRIFWERAWRLADLTQLDPDRADALMMLLAATGQHLTYEESDPDDIHMYQLTFPAAIAEMQRLQRQPTGTPDREDRLRLYYRLWAKALAVPEFEDFKSINGLLEMLHWNRSQQASYLRAMPPNVGIKEPNQGIDQLFELAQWNQEHPGHEVSFLQLLAASTPDALEYIRTLKRANPKRIRRSLAALKKELLPPFSLRRFVMHPLRGRGTAASLIFPLSPLFWKMFMITFVVAVVAVVARILRWKMNARWQKQFDAAWQGRSWQTFPPGRKTRERLLRFVQEGNNAAVVDAVKALGTLEDASLSIPALLRLLSPAPPEVTRAILTLVSRLGDQTQVAATLPFLEGAFPRSVAPGFVRFPALRHHVVALLRNPIDRKWVAKLLMEFGWRPESLEEEFFVVLATQEVTDETKFQRWLMEDLPTRIPLCLLHIATLRPENTETALNAVLNSPLFEADEWRLQFFLHHPDPEEKLRALLHFLKFTKLEGAIWDRRLRESGLLPFVLEFTNSAILKHLLHLTEKDSSSYLRELLHKRLAFAEVISAASTIRASISVHDDLTRMIAIAESVFRPELDLEEMNKQLEDIAKEVLPRLQAVNPALAAALPDANSLLTLAAIQQVPYGEFIRRSSRISALIKIRPESGLALAAHFAATAQHLCSLGYEDEDDIAMYLNAFPGLLDEVRRLQQKDRTPLENAALRRYFRLLAKTMVSPAFATFSRMTEVMEVLQWNQSQRQPYLDEMPFSVGVKNPDQGDEQIRHLISWNFKNPDRALSFEQSLAADDPDSIAYNEGLSRGGFPAAARFLDENVLPRRPYRGGATEFLPALVPLTLSGDALGLTGPLAMVCLVVTGGIVGWKSLTPFLRPAPAPLSSQHFLFIQAV